MKFEGVDAAERGAWYRGKTVSGGKLK